MTTPYFEMGDFPKSKDHYEKGFRILEKNRLWTSYFTVAKASFAKSKVLNKEKDVDLAALYALAEKAKIKIFKGEIHRNVGEILLNIDDNHMPEAERWIQKSIETDRENGLNFYLGKDYAAYAELSKRKGDIPKAREQLTKAIDIFKGCGADGWVTRTEEKLASIS